MTINEKILEGKTEVLKAFTKMLFKPQELTNIVKDSYTLGDSKVEHRVYVAAAQGYDILKYIAWINVVAAVVHSIIKN